MKTITDLLNTLPQIGRVEWIALPPARDQPLEEIESVKATQASGLVGDRFSGREGNPRQVTLIQYEHLPVIAACLARIFHQKLVRSLVS